MNTTAAGTAREGMTVDTSETTRLRALLRRATQTPWRQDGTEITVVGSTLGVDGGETVVAECTLPDCIVVANEDREEQEERNAALIVGAVNALPGLLDAAEQMQLARDIHADYVRTSDENARRGAAALIALTERAERAERERDDLAATLETRTAEHALAMARVRELEAIIAGRTTPPTDAEIAAHDGAWLVSGRGLALALSGQKAADCAYNARSAGAEWRWLPIADDGRPCAWPTAEVSR